MREAREVTQVHEKWTQCSDGCCQTPSQLRAVVGVPRRECLLLNWPLVQEAAQERGSWGWNGQRGTGHRAQEHKVGKGWGRTVALQEKPGFQSDI